MVYEELEKALKEAPNTKFKFLPGNHDQFTVSGRNALEILGLHPQIKVFTEPEWDEDGLWVPYRLNHDDLRAALKLRKPKGSKPICFIHHGLKNSMMNNQIVNSEGLEEKEFDKKFERIYLGHYHKHQVLGRAVYVGSPYETSWAEISQPKGVLLTRGADFEFFGLEVGPKHFLLEYDGEGKPKVPKGFRDGFDRIKVVAKVTHDKAQELGVQEKLAKAGITHAVVDYVPQVQQEARLALSPSESPRDMVKRFLANCEKPEDLDPALLETTLFGATENVI
jgi:DNA repair exonuclease SbcCD nuclease subunit